MKMQASLKSATVEAPSEPGVSSSESEVCGYHQTSGRQSSPSGTLNNEPLMRWYWAVGSGDPGNFIWMPS